MMRGPESSTPFVTCDANYLTPLVERSVAYARISSISSILPMSRELGCGLNRRALALRAVRGLSDVTVRWPRAGMPRCIWISLFQSLEPRFDVGLCFAVAAIDGK